MSEIFQALADWHHGLGLFPPTIAFIYGSVWATFWFEGWLERGRFWRVGRSNKP